MGVGTRIAIIGVCFSLSIPSLLSFSLQGRQPENIITAKCDPGRKKGRTQEEY